MSKQKFAPLLAVVALLAVLYGGFKGYVYYQVSSELDRMITMVRPFADISYGGISSGLDGTLAVEQIQVSPQGSGVPGRQPGPDVSFTYAGKGP